MTANNAMHITPPPKMQDAQGAVNIPNKSKVSEISTDNGLGVFAVSDQRRYKDDTE